MIQLWRLDCRTVHSTPDSGGYSRYEGYKNRKVSNFQFAIATLGHLPVKVEQAAAGEHDELAFVGTGHIWKNVTALATVEGIELEVVNLGAGKCGFVLLPLRGPIERSSVVMARSPLSRPRK